LAPVTLASRADEPGGPPLKVLRDLGQPRARYPAGDRAHRLAIM